MVFWLKAKVLILHDKQTYILSDEKTTKSTIITKQLPQTIKFNFNQLFNYKQQTTLKMYKHSKHPTIQQN